MTNWRYPKDVRGWLTEAEGRTLAELASEKRVLEVGTFAGLSTCCMAQTASEVVAVDPHDHGFGETESEAADNLKRYAGGPWHLVRGRIQTKAATLRGPFDGLFLDSSHGEKETIEEFRACERFLGPDAWIALHDWGAPPALPGWFHWPGVKAAADRLFSGPPVRAVDTLAVFNRSQTFRPREPILNHRYAALPARTLPFWRGTSRNYRPRGRFAGGSPLTPCRAPNGDERPRGDDVFAAAGLGNPIATPVSNGSPSGGLLPGRRQPSRRRAVQRSGGVPPSAPIPSGFSSTKPADSAD